MSKLEDDQKQHREEVNAKLKEQQTYWEKQVYSMFMELMCAVKVIDVIPGFRISQRFEGLGRYYVM